MHALFKIWDKLEEGILFFCLCFMTIITFANVVARKLMPSFSLSYTEELTVMLFVWITMFGSAICYKHGAHLGLTLVTDRLPPKVQSCFVILGGLCSAAFLILLIKLGWSAMLNQIQYGQKMPALHISAAWGGAAIPIGSAFILFRAVEAAVRDFRTFFSPKERDGETV